MREICHEMRGKQGTGIRDKEVDEWFEPRLIQGMVLLSTGNIIGEFRRLGAFECIKDRHSAPVVDNSAYD